MTSFLAFIGWIAMTVGLLWVGWFFRGLWEAIQGQEGP